MHKKIVGGREYQVADTMEEAFIAWFGEKVGKELAAIPPTAPRKKCVYLVEFNNGWCKIGVAKDFDKRLKTVTSSSGATPLRWCPTDILPNKDAYKIESKCHKKFAPYRCEGEFFNIPYEDAYHALEEHAMIIEHN